MRKIRLTVGVTLAILTVIIVLQNMEAAQTDVLFFTIEMPRAILLGCTALGGFIVGLLVSMKVR